MKHSILLALCAFPLLLSSCGKNPSSDPSFSSGESSLEGEVPSLSSSVVPEMDFSSSPWGEEAAKASFEALGTVIPYLECAEFEFVTGIDDYGDPTIRFYLYYETDEEATKAFTDYAYACAEAWYRVDIQENSYFDPDTYQLYTFTVAYADALVEQNKAVEIASVVSTYKNRPCLGLFCITYLYIPQDVYPALAVEEVTQGEISLPALEGEGYTYSFSLFFEETFGNLACQFVVYGGDYSLEEQYFDLLLFSDFALCRVNEGDDTVEENLYEYPGIELGCYYMAYLSHYAVVFYYSFDVNGLSVEVYNLQPQD